MTLEVKHRFQTAKADGTDNTLVKPTNWNDTHLLETDATTGMVLGRDTSGPGEIQELPLLYNPASGGQWRFGGTGGSSVSTGTTAQRPAGPTPGSIRYNTDLAVLEVYTATGWLAVVLGSGVPVGTILPYGGPSIPAGFFLCDGSRLSRASWPALYGAIGLIWDSTNDGSTFMVPYLVGRALVMADYGGGVLGFAMGIGGRFGAPSNGYYPPLPDHNHNLLAGHTFAAQPANIGGSGSGNLMQELGGAWLVDHTTNVGSGAGMNISTIQPSAAMYMMIKY